MCVFIFGITDVGQTVFRGHIPPNVDHGQLDEIYMGAAFAPWVYGLVPGVTLALVGSGLLVVRKVKHR
jgi:hypothetical protein